MIQLTAVTTLFGAASAAAAIDAGLLGDPDERVLVISNNAPIPEVVRSLADTPGAEAVLSRFDRVVDLGALLHPQTPSRWKVFAIDLPAQERLLRTYFELGDSPVELVVESVHVPPAETLTKVFNEARITILSEGLMSFGPTRNPQSHTFGQRLDGMVYLDLVEGLDPLLLSEHGIESHAIAPEHFRRLIEEICVAAQVPAVEDPAPTALVLGQYLSALRLITPQQETRMQVDMLKAAKSMGAERVLFKPHPSAPATNTAALVAAAGKEGLAIELVNAELSAEAVMATHRLVGVVAGFSTALATAQRVFGLPTRCIGTRVMFDALDPYQNSNRIPVTIIDFLHRNADREDAIDELRRLTVAVAYTMQPDSLADRRDEAVAYLEGLPEAERTRYITQARLTKLGLPGGRRPVLPPQVSKAAHDAMERVPPGLSKSVYGSWRKLANARQQRA
ncbi:polysialyltransferase family glycosyltransferase [Demequina gelatinilytica]|uniref:polysialyltransferase family glycosyltransferase n=1 Tax=Demequina gelatinilytica TaxID=1638980 RepID=UPI0007823980|nr:polysialyltransferase family glycosyltransferase [Demequina gelatinilytica]